MADTVFEGRLSNGIMCSLQESKSFVGDSQLALQLNDEFVAIISMNSKRNNIIECKVVKSNKVHFDLNNPDAVKAPAKLDLADK